MTCITRTEHIMGTSISITIRSDRDVGDDMEASFAVFRSYEEEFSRFRPDSALSQLNQSKKIIPSVRFLQILELCDRLHDETAGVFNPLVSLRHLGYSESFEKWQFRAIHEKVDTDWSGVSFSPEYITLREYQSLDLGGIVKWYSVDTARDYLFARGYTDFIINAGGDIYLAGNDDGQPWRIGIDNPMDTNEVLATVDMRDGSISTSWTYKRKWELDGIQYHHIVDPRNGTNPTEIMSISVIWQHTWMTDVYATIALIMGVDASISWLESLWLVGIIISKTGEIYTTKGLERYSFTLFT